MCQYLHFRRINVTSTIGGVVRWRILHQHKPQIHLLPSYELKYPIQRRFWVRSHQDMIGIGKGIHLFAWVQKDKRLILESTSKDPEQSFSIDSFVGCLWNISPHRPSYGNPFNSFFWMPKNKLFKKCFDNFYRSKHMWASQSQFPVS